MFIGHHSLTGRQNASSGLERNRFGPYRLKFWFDGFGYHNGLMTLVRPQLCILAHKDYNIAL